MDASTPFLRRLRIACGGRRLVLVIAGLAILMPALGPWERARRTVREARRRRQRSSAGSPLRRCPTCGRVVPPEAGLCAGCSSRLEPWVHDADGVWWEQDGRGRWRRVAADPDDAT